MPACLILRHFSKRQRKFVVYFASPTRCHKIVSFEKEFKLFLSPQVINMGSQWVMRNFPIKQYASGQILIAQVRGQACAGFGIHQMSDGGGWSITHLKSGWATFMTRTEEGAKLIADYLTDNYAAEFARLNVSGCAVENFRLLAEAIETDEALWNLRRLYAISDHDLNRRGKEPQPKLEVMS